jgi:tetratricopeptide (TPR) repeat protein
MNSVTMRSIVVAAIRQGDMRKATELAIHALQEGQRDALFLNLRAQALEEQGRDAEALDDLDAASKLAPRDTGVLQALGLLRLRVGQAGAAGEAFARMVALSPQYAQAHFCLGLAQEALGDLDRAAQSFRTADGLEPGRAETLARLAALAARRADWLQARHYADLALARNPKEVDAQFVLATADLETGATPHAAERLRPLAVDGSLPPAVRATAASLLGDALDAQDDVDGAFRAYEEASGNYVKAFAPLFASRATALDQVAMLQRAYRDAPSARSTIRASTDAESGHAFLLGFPRSGTTLLEQVLGAHPRIATTEERDHLGQASELLANPDAVERIAKLSEGDLARYRNAYWASVAAGGADVRGRLFLDKLPLNTIKLPVIRRLFPSAKIFFALRDPRDVVFSCFRRRFAMNPSMYELLTLSGAAKYYGAVMGIFETYKEKLSLDVHTIRYEDVVNDLPAEGRRICGILGLDWQDAMQDIAASSRISATPSALQVKKGLYAGGIGQWKRYERHLAPALDQVAPWVTHWGYDRGA